MDMTYNSLRHHNFSFLYDAGFTEEEIEKLRRTPTPLANISIDRENSPGRMKDIYRNQCKSHLLPLFEVANIGLIELGLKYITIPLHLSDKFDDARRYRQIGIASNELILSTMHDFILKMRRMMPTQGSDTLEQITELSSQWLYKTADEHMQKENRIPCAVAEGPLGFHYAPEMTIRPNPVIDSDWHSLWCCLHMENPRHRLYGLIPIYFIALEHYAFLAQTVKGQHRPKLSQIGSSIDIGSLALRTLWLQIERFQNGARTFQDVFVGKMD